MLCYVEFYDNCEGITVVPVERVVEVREDVQQLCGVEMTKSVPDSIQYCKEEVAVITEVDSQQYLVETIPQLSPEIYISIFSEGEIF